MKTNLLVLSGGFVLLVVLLGLVAGSSARAQIPGAAASCDVDEVCYRLANQALEYSQAGRFEAAQRAYKAAYAQQPDAKLLFNLARVLHKDGRLADAVTYYQKYLDAGAEGSAELRLKAQQRMEEARREQTLRGAAGKSAKRPAQSLSMLPDASPVSSESAPSVPLYRKWWLWTLVGVATVGVAVGIGLGVAAQRPDLKNYAIVQFSTN